MDPRYNADIRWTSYGIPHVKADDWGSLGYGFAYATAKDGVCVFARHAVMANGTLAADMGPSPENIASDGLHRALISEDSVRRYEDGLTDNTRAFNQGFIAGYNRYLRDNADTLPAGCAGEKWLRPLNQETMARMTAAFGIRYGLGTVVEGIAAASPPGNPLPVLRLIWMLRQRWAVMPSHLARTSRSPVEAFCSAIRIIPGRGRRVFT